MTFVSEQTLSYLAIQSPKPRRKSSMALTGFSPLLDAFIVGEENSGVREIVDPSVISELHFRSPVLLYGPSGVGKTAIALTIASRWLNDRPNRTYNLIHALDFARSLVLAIESDDMARFREQFRECDCLLIDNVHELAGKEAAQNELVEMLNGYESKDSLILFTSISLPPLLTAWHPGLGSRMMAGHSLELNYPSLEARNELLKRLCVAQGVDAEDPQLRLLNRQISENMTAVQLKGLLSRWQHHHRTLNQLEVTDSERVLESLVVQEEAAAKNPLDIAKLVARELRQTLESMRGPSRKAAVVRARGLAMYIIRQTTDASFQSIGELFGNRDHTTVMHACRKTEDDLANDVELARCVDRLKQKI